MDKKVKVYGPHMMLDCYGADPDKLDDVNVVYSFLEDLPPLIGMDKVGVPQLARFIDPSKAGISGIIMIVTSHISIHTYSLKKCFFVDVFSCKPFEAKVVLDYVKRVFTVEEVEFSLVQRGRRFPLNNL